MRWVHALGAAVAATTLVGSTAKAVLSMSLVQVPVPGSVASQISSSPVRTYQLQVTQTASEKFNVANLQLTLASGSGLSGYLYASPNTVGGVNPNVTGDSSTVDPYSTYVTTPAFEQTHSASTLGTDLAVTGSADWPVGPGSNTAVVPTSAGNSVGSNQTMNIVWGDPQSATANNTSGASTYTIAQFTVVGNTGGFIRGYFGQNTSNVAQYFKPDNATGPLDAALAPLNGGNGGAIYLPIFGDINKDGTTGSPDLNAVLNNFGLNGTGDANGDGQTGSPDLNAVLNNFGNNITAPATGVALGSVVPEPATLGLLGLAGLVTIRRRK